MLLKFFLVGGGYVYVNPSRVSLIEPVAAATPEAHETCTVHHEQGHAFHFDIPADECVAIFRAEQRKAQMPPPKTADAKERKEKSKREPAAVEPK